MSAIIRNIIELDETSFEQLIRESRGLTCNWFQEIQESDHVLRFRGDKKNLNPEVQRVLDGHYYSSAKEIEFVSPGIPRDTRMPALYRVVGDSGLYECYLADSRVPLLSEATLKSAMEKFLLLPKSQSWKFPANKKKWSSEEFGPMNKHEKIVIFDDYAMVNSNSFERYTYEFLSELIELRYLESLKLSIFFTRAPSSQDDIERCIEHLRGLPIEIHIAWFQMKPDAKKILSGTHQRFMCASSFEIVRDGGFNTTVNSKNMRVNRHFCNASQIEGNADFLRNLSDELKKFQPRRRSPMISRCGGEVDEVIKSSLPLVPFIIPISQ